MEKDQKTELGDELMDLIGGGILTPEAEQWIKDNRDNVVRKAGPFLGALAQMGIDYVKNDSKLYDVQDLKDLLKNNFGIEV